MSDPRDDARDDSSAHITGIGNGPNGYTFGRGRPLGTRPVTQSDSDADQIRWNDE